MAELDGLRALVTGGSSGIGAETARRLAQAGAVVAVHGLDEAEASAVAEEIRADGGCACAFAADLALDGGAAELSGEVLRRLGGVEILVNNAGGLVGGAHGDWFEAGPQDWLATYRLNVVSGAELAAAFAPGMRARGFGRVIQIASTTAASPLASGPHYGASKAAAANMTVSLAKALAGSGVTVNTVTPGPIVTPAFKRAYIARAEAEGRSAAWQDVEAEEVRRRGLPAGRLGRPQDVAAAVLFLAGEDAGFICGANLRVDGGSNGFVN